LNFLIYSDYKNTPTFLNEFIYNIYICIFIFDHRIAIIDKKIVLGAQYNNKAPNFATPELYMALVQPVQYNANWLCTSFGI